MRNNDVGGKEIEERKMKLKVDLEKESSAEYSHHPKLISKRTKPNNLNNSYLSETASNYRRTDMINKSIEEMSESRTNCALNSSGHSISASKISKSIIEEDYLRGYFMRNSGRIRANSVESARDYFNNRSTHTKNKNTNSVAIDKENKKNEIEILKITKGYYK